ncbi:uncharacterized protein PV07_06500 [Cladophialophora immunda]|uniref:Uncharacterized protein n=1 Tax=Cladophialophora immunda TaxID=569365 RepID=A0A0D2ANL4_9EURO|nr:uncharacterized protein PV07_06500 [Cladophialophora immunda]KIW26687.1 hypothetical protein PV07_06500 [Cladophialophora immunda]OQV01951.1 hypothetical protein CLAIMM_07221 [Cladophialophora immunda]
MSSRSLDIRDGSDAEQLSNRRVVSALVEPKDQSAGSRRSSAVNVGVQEQRAEKKSRVTFGVLRPPPGKWLVEMIVELAALIAAVAFGAYAVKSVTLSNRGNTYSSRALQQALTSNQLTLLTICLGSLGADRLSESSVKKQRK